MGGATVHEQLCLLHALPQSNHVTSASMPQSKHATSASTAPKQARRVSQHCPKASTSHQPALPQSKHVASASTAPKQARCVSHHCFKASTSRQPALLQSKHVASASTAPKQARCVSWHCPKASTLRQPALPQSKHIASASTLPVAEMAQRVKFAAAQVLPCGWDHLLEVLSMVLKGGLRTHTAGQGTQKQVVCLHACAVMQPGSHSSAPRLGPLVRPCIFVTYAHCFHVAVGVTFTLALRPPFVQHVHCCVQTLLGA